MARAIDANNDVIDALNRLTGTLEAQFRVNMLIARQMHLSGTLDGGVFADEIDLVAQRLPQDETMMAVAREKLMQYGDWLRGATPLWEADRKKLLRTAAHLPASRKRQQ